MPADSDSFDWEAEGRRLGDAFDALHAIVVLGHDPTETALVAIGIARAQAPKRRVALGDLLGEAEPIERLVSRDDPHGLVDSFTFGVSLNRIALPVPGEGELFVMPSGTQTPDYDDILPNPRWRRLADGFREVGALLIVAAPAAAPAIESLVEQTDGAVLVGESVPRHLPVAQVLAAVRRPRESKPAAVRPATAEGAKRSSSPRRRLAAIIGVLLACLLAAAGLWLAYRPLAGRSGIRRSAAETALAKVPLTLPDSTGRPDSNPNGSALAVPVVSDPLDSAAVAAFSVAMTNTNTEAGAILTLQENGRNLPAVTYAPIPIEGVRWFRVLAGVYHESTTADSLLAALRARGLLDARSGSVVRAPFAFVLDSGIAASAVPVRIAKYAGQGLPVYGLLQSDGSARLYAGAFEAPAQAAMYAESLRAAGITPVLAYRIGRVF